MPAEAGVGSRPSDSSAWPRSIGLLIAWALALAAGEWLAQRASSGLWGIPAVRSADPGSLPFYGSLLLGLLGLSWLFAGHASTPWLPQRWSWLGVLGLLAALGCNALGAALRQAIQGRPFPAFHGPKSWLAFVAGGILCPIVEEWIFRGVLWRLASDAVGQLKSPLRALVATGFTAVLFAAWHIPFAGTTFFGYNLAFGAFLGVSRWRLGAVGPGVVVHALGNSFYLLTI